MTGSYIFICVYIFPYPIQSGQFTVITVFRRNVVSRVVTEVTKILFFLPAHLKRLVHFILWYFKFFMCQCKNFYLHVKHLSLKHVIENFRHSFYTMFGFYHSV